MTYPHVKTITFRAGFDGKHLAKLRFVMMGEQIYVLADDIYRQFGIDLARQPELWAHLDALAIDKRLGLVWDKGQATGPFVLLSEAAVDEISGFASDEISQGIFAFTDVQQTFMDAVLTINGWQEIARLLALMDEGEIDDAGFRFAVNRVAAVMLISYEQAQPAATIGGNGLPQLSPTEVRELVGLLLNDAEVAMLNSLSDSATTAYRAARLLLKESHRI